MRTIITLMFAAAATTLAGCSLFTPPEADPKLAADLSKLVYPKDAALGEDLDMVVVRTDRQTIRINNRTPRTYPPMQLWINRQWVGLTREITIGDNNVYDLKEFINQYGEPFRVGAWLQPDKVMPVCQPELFDPNTGNRYRLLARDTWLNR